MAEIPQRDYVEIAQGIRNEEQWERYDSVVIGPTAKDIDKGWFESWEQMVTADSVKFFVGARSSAGLDYTNLSGEDEDFAQLFYQFGVEFSCPVFDAEQSDQPFDLEFAKQWVTNIPRRMSVKLELAGVDNVLKIPANHAPSGYGATEMRTGGEASPVVSPGVSGVASYTNSWHWPRPIGIPKNGKVAVEMKLGQPWAAMLKNVSAPGNIDFTWLAPPVAGAPPVPRVVKMPAWFVIRCWFRGPRYVQLRGARSAG